MQGDGSVLIASAIDTKGIEDGLDKIKNMLGKGFGESAFANLQKSIDLNKNKTALKSGFSMGIFISLISFRLCR